MKPSWIVALFLLQGHAGALQLNASAQRKEASTSCSTSSSSPAVGCESVYTSGCRTSGVFWIQPDSGQSAFQVYCSMDDPHGDGGGWTLVFGMQSTTYRNWLQECTYSANMLDPTTADGCASNLALTLGKAKYIKWTDTSSSYTPFLLAEFQTIGDYYTEVFSPVGTPGTSADGYAYVRYPKGPYSSWGWVSTVGPWRSFTHAPHLWAHFLATDEAAGDPVGYKCWWDIGPKDRPFYNDNGGSNEAHRCEGYDPPYSYPSTAKRGGTFDYLIWIKDEEGQTPTHSTMTTTSPPDIVIPDMGGAAATGDPHLQNVLGQRFDLMKPGKHVLINIPRGWHKNAMLRVEAEARQIGGQCTDMYFKDLNITGTWVEATGTGGLRFEAEGVHEPNAKWLMFGKVQLKVARGHTREGIQYLNFYVKHLGHSGFDVGGLLGQDDHSEAAMITTCAHKVALIQISGSSDQAASVASVAEASFV